MYTVDSSAVYTSMHVGINYNNKEMQGMLGIFIHLEHS